MAESGEGAAAAGDLKRSSREGTRRAGLAAADEEEMAGQTGGVAGAGLGTRAEGDGHWGSGAEGAAKGEEAEEREAAPGAWGMKEGVMWRGWPGTKPGERAERLPGPPEDPKAPPPDPDKGGRGSACLEARRRSKSRRSSFSKNRIKSPRLQARLGATGLAGKSLV